MAQARYFCEIQIQVCLKKSFDNQKEYKIINDESNGDNKTEKKMQYNL